MKWISSATALLLTVLSCQAATLVWDPSSTNGAPAPAFYRMHSSPVGSPAFGTWTTYGETTSTNLLVTNNVYRMFRVVAVTASGIESVPSNVVTNDFAQPNPPGTLRLNAAIELAPTPAGPWNTATNQNGTPAVIDVEVPVTSSNQFFRARLALR